MAHEADDEQIEAIALDEFGDAADRVTGDEMGGEVDSLEPRQVTRPLDDRSEDVVGVESYGRFRGTPSPSRK
jgi:hypothetical protein